MEIAEERLAGTGIRCYVTPGNDDFWVIDDTLRGSDAVEYVEGRCVRIDDHHEMVTTGYSNITPWNSPRELEEDAALGAPRGDVHPRRGSGQPDRRPALPAARNGARPGARDRRRVRVKSRAARCAWGRWDRRRCAASSSSTSRCSGCTGTCTSRRAPRTRADAVHQPRLGVHLGRSQLRHRLALRRQAARVPVHDRMRAPRQ